MASDGCLTFLGRKDLRVKIRGYSVDLTEIETALLNYPSVKEAVVAAAGDDDKRLIAYIAAKPRQTLNIKELRNSVKAMLPDHMMPAAFVALDALPVNPNGKVDRRSLPEPANTRPDVSTLYVAPRTPMEEELARIWGEVLCVDRVGIHDNFFDLGGHSLAATRVVSRVIRSLGVDMRAQSLLQAATVADMAAAILQAKVKTIGQEDAASILSELEALTDEEAQGYLTKT
jgi:acyl carrier protein